MENELWETLYAKILEGDILKVLAYVWETLTKEDIFLNGDLKKICIEFLVLAIVGGVFMSFMDSFQTKEVSKMGYLMIHVLMFSTLITVFFEMMQIAKDVLEKVITVMNMAIPTYYVALISSGNVLSASSYYRISVLIIYVVEQLLLHILLPFASCYMILSFGNALWLERKLSMITEFMKKTITFLLKAMVSIVTGIGFLQAMVSPVMDNLKNETLQKTVSILPKVGNLAKGITELTMGSLVLIKNSVGVCIFMVLLLTAAIPVLKLFLASILLKGCSALMALVTEKDFSKPVMETAEGIQLLLQIVLTVLFLFVISIAIVLFTTN